MNIIKLSAVTLTVYMFAMFLADMPAFAQRLKGNGNMQTQTRNVSGFKGIDVSGGFEVQLTQGNNESVRIEAEENLLGNIITEVKGGVLHIYNEGSITTSKGMKAHITVRELNKVNISGGVKVIGNSTFKSDAFALNMSGGTNVKLAIEARKLKAEMSGASKVELTGRADDATYSMSGASNIQAQDLISDQVKVDASGASKVRVHANKKLDINGSGASSISYKGSPSITSDVSGGTRVSRL